MTTELNDDLALAWLVLGIINEHAPWDDDPSEDDPVMGSPGCIINCGPCAALHWFYLNDQGYIDELIKMTGWGKDGWTFWDAEVGTLNWTMIKGYWDRHKGCGSVNGVPTPCDFRDTDFAEDDEDIDSLIAAFERGKRARIVAVTDEPHQCFEGHCTHWEPS